MKLALFINFIFFGHAVTRPITIGSETYTLRLTSIPCDPKIPCGTVFRPRRYRGIVLKDGEVVGKFDRPCVGACEGLESTVIRAIGNVGVCDREAR